MDTQKLLTDIVEQLRTEVVDLQQSKARLEGKVEDLEGDLHGKECELTNAQDEAQAYASDSKAEWNQELS